jgi:HlyD family secretion protein
MLSRPEAGWVNGGSLLRYCQLILLGLLLGLAVTADAAEATASSDMMPLSGVGAFGTIQPRSRVITVAHDGGAEGVRIEKIMVAEGDEVENGQVIATFSDLVRKMARLSAVQSKEKIIQANLDRERANLAYLEKAYGRLDKLRHSPAVTQQQIDRALRDLEMSRFTVESLKFEMMENALNITLAESEVEQGMLRSPIDGTVLELLARPGERAMNDGIIRMADLSSFDVIAEVYQRDIHKVRVGQKVEVLHPGSDEVHLGTVDHVGHLVKKSRLFFADPSLDRDERVIEVRARLEADTATEVRHMINAEVRVRFR